MNPRVGFAAFLICGLAASVVACRGYAVAPTGTPAPVRSPSPAPDTLYVQDSSSRSVRVYKNASQLSGVAVALETLPTSDITSPDVVFSPLHDVLWYPRAYPSLTFTGNISTPILVWDSASTKNGKNPDATVAFMNSEGTATYDVTHDLLFVAEVTDNIVHIFASAHLLTSSSTPAATVALVMVDAQASPMPRPQELFYDATNDRLFVSDDAAVVGVFDGFGAKANAAAIAHSSISVTANRQMTGLFSPDGLAYNAAADVLFVAEDSKKQIVVIHSASTFSGGVGHSQTITGFVTGPTGLAEDAVRDILFVYDPVQVGIWVIPNATAAGGAVQSVPNRRTFFDASSALSGFGLFVDTTH